MYPFGSHSQAAFFVGDTVSSFNLYIYIYIYIYIYSLKESEDGQLLTIKKLKNLIKNKNVSVLDLHQLHEKLNLSNLPK